MVLAALNLKGKKILAVGGGAVATRKLSNVLEREAEILIISPEISETIREWVSQGQLDWMQETYQTDSLFIYKPHIVFAASNDWELNDKIARDARKIGAWVNNATDSENSDFYGVATVEKYPISVGISTNATAPALMKVLKERIEQVPTDDVAQLATWLAEIRPIAKDAIAAQSERQALYRQIVDSDILDLLQKGDITSARRRFEALTEGLS